VWKRPLRIFLIWFNLIFFNISVFPFAHLFRSFLMFREKLFSFFRRVSFEFENYFCPISVRMKFGNKSKTKIYTQKKKTKKKSKFVVVKPISVLKGQGSTSIDWLTTCGVGMEILRYLMINLTKSSYFWMLSFLCYLVPISNWVQLYSVPSYLWICNLRFVLNDLTS